MVNLFFLLSFILVEAFDIQPVAVTVGPPIMEREVNKNNNSDLRTYATHTVEKFQGNKNISLNKTGYLNISAPDIIHQDAANRSNGTNTVPGTNISNSFLFRFASSVISTMESVGKQRSETVGSAHIEAQPPVHTDGSSITQAGRNEKINEENSWQDTEDKDARKKESEATPQNNSGLKPKLHSDRSKNTVPILELNKTDIPKKSSEIPGSNSDNVFEEREEENIVFSKSFVLIFIFIFVLLCCVIFPIFKIYNKRRNYYDDDDEENVYTLFSRNSVVHNANSLDHLLSRTDTGESMSSPPIVLRDLNSPLEISEAYKRK